MQVSQSSTGLAMSMIIGARDRGDGDEALICDVMRRQRFKCEESVRDSSSRRVSPALLAGAQPPCFTLSLKSVTLSVALHAHFPAEPLFSRSGSDTSELEDHNLDLEHLCKEYCGMSPSGLMTT